MAMTFFFLQSMDMAYVMMSLVRSCHLLRSPFLNIMCVCLFAHSTSFVQIVSGDHCLIIS